jgi:hypothetical protein
MMRYPWTLAAALFAFGVIAWVVWLSALQRTRCGSRLPGPWLPTLTFDRSQSAALTCGQSGDNDQACPAAHASVFPLVLAQLQPATRTPDPAKARQREPAGFDF